MQLSICPRCSTPLSEINYSYNSGVKIKKCNECSGMWLPIHQTLNLIALAKLSQTIAPDLKAVGKELKRHEESIQSHKSLKKGTDELKRPVSIVRSLLATEFLSLLPLYDENPRSVAPVVTMALVITNILVFFGMYLSNQPRSFFLEILALHPAEVVQFNSLFTILSSQFIHGGLLHLMGNMLFLWIFGDNVEERLGSAQFAVFYLLCGSLAGLAHTLSSPASMVPTVGASGAISGFLGAYFYLFPHVNIKTLAAGYIVDLPAWTYLGLWFGLQVLATAMAPYNTGVAWWAHIGGFVSGAFILYVYDWVNGTRRMKPVD